MKNKPSLIYEKRNVFYDNKRINTYNPLNFFKTMSSSVVHFTNKR